MCLQGDILGQRICKTKQKYSVKTASEKSWVILLEQITDQLSQFYVEPGSLAQWKG